MQVQKKIERVVLFFLRHLLLHLNIDFNTFLCAQFDFGRIHTITYCTRVFYDLLLFFLTATRTPLRREHFCCAVLLFSLILIVLHPHFYIVFVSLEPFALTSPAPTTCSCLLILHKYNFDN